MFFLKIALISLDYLHFCTDFKINLSVHTKKKKNNNNINNNNKAVRILIKIWLHPYLNLGKIAIFNSNIESDQLVIGKGTMLINGKKKVFLTNGSETIIYSH